MRIALTILSFLTLISCSTNNDCDNRYNFSNCNLNIPIVQIDYSAHFDTVRQDIRDLFEDDLCKKCSWIDFKIPFEFEGNKGYLKVIADFNYPVCENCPVPVRLRHYYSILINRNNQLLVNGQLMGVDSLSSSIITYFNNVGNSEGHFPKEHRHVNFRLYWETETEKTLIDKVLTEVSEAHYCFVKLKVAENGLEFCKLTTEELDGLKNKYPLRIEFDLGKTEKQKPPTHELIENIKAPEVLEELEIEEEA